MASSTDYVFTRDYLDNNRINLQHYLAVQLFGYRIHPSSSSSQSSESTYSANKQAPISRPSG
ncbi:hypothetical protein BDV39DRAFT_208521 [Aspergillus sergii]|uniref:Uncharacterized protein n=1 Tax=Aspergillus sergii TaxID=1034303 RepID=A0A5N6WSX6_9EURO|nr:hypothetical protein BDV39DRAFT_208521 [Aspergillus sergii]